MTPPDLTPEQRAFVVSELRALAACAEGSVARRRKVSQELARVGGGGKSVGP